MIFNTSSNISNVELKPKICFLRPVVHSPSSSYIKSHIAICVINALLSIVGTILNSLLLYIFWKSPQRREKVAYFLIMVLSCVDLGVVAIVQPLFISFLINEILESSRLCLQLIAFCLPGILSYAMSVSTLFTINIQRYLSIVCPIWHRTIAMKKRFLLTSLFISFIYLLTFLIRLLVPNYSWIGPGSFFFIFFSTSFFFYLSIFLVARNKLLANANQVNNNSDEDNSTTLVSFLRELKLAKPYILIVLLFSFCYLPYYIVLVYRKIESTINERTILATDWTITLVLINSCLNCCVFFWAKRDLRKEGLKIIRKCFYERYGR